MYATVGTRLIALTPAAFAKPAALSMRASPATGVPFRRSRSRASLARFTFATPVNGGLGGCISTMTGKSVNGRALINDCSAGSILSSAAESARAGGAIGALLRAQRQCEAEGAALTMAFRLCPHAAAVLDHPAVGEVEAEPVSLDAS